MPVYVVVEGGAVVGTTLGRLPAPADACVAAVSRDLAPMEVRPELALMSGDVIRIACRVSDEHVFDVLFGREARWDPTES